MLVELVKEDFRLFGQYYKLYGEKIPHFISVTTPALVPDDVKDSFDEAILGAWSGEPMKITLNGWEQKILVEIVYRDALLEYLTWLKGEHTDFENYKRLMKALKYLDKELSEDEKKDLYEDIFLKIRNELEESISRYLRW